jgi:glycosyltransferase involved in cell wall biosynthesis
MPPPQRPKILLLIPHLGGGGSERVIETLARSLNPEKYEIHLCLITRPQTETPSLTVPIHQLRARRVRHSGIRLLRLIWRLQPDLILSGIAHLNLLALALKPLLPRTTRIIVRQNGALTEAFRPHSPRLSRRAYSLGYRRAHCVICQTHAMAREIQSGLRVNPAQLVILPNPTDIVQIRSRTTYAQPTSPTPTILAIGRLVPEKGFDLLLAALAALPSPFHRTELYLVGSGPQLSALQRQAQELGIGDRIHFTGNIPDPVIQLRHASLFVLSSRTEGLSNALLEAAAAGLPVVATPASAGLLELIRDKQGVWLSSDISSHSLSIALQHCLTAIQPNQRYPHQWIEQFDLHRSIAAYESTIDSVIASPAR